MFIRNIGRKIKQKREEKGITQEMLGNKVGRTREQINAIESGRIKRPLKKEVLEKIAVELDVSVEKLLSLDENLDNAANEDKDKDKDKAVYEFPENKVVFEIHEGKGSYTSSNEKKDSHISKAKRNFIKSALPEKLLQTYPICKMDTDLMAKNEHFNMILANEEKRIVLIYKSYINIQIINSFLEDISLLKKYNPTFNIEGVIIVFDDDKSIDEMKSYIEMIPSITVKKVKLEYQMSFEDICAK